MSYQLNKQSLERLKAMVRAGNYIDRAWKFTAADANQLLGEPPNWTDYDKWFLGLDATQPAETKDRYDYPYGKAGQVNLAALRAIASKAKASGDGSIASAAAAVLATAKQMDADRLKAAAPGGNLISFTVPLPLKAASKSESGKPPTFDLVAYTGGAMELEGWTYPVVVDLEGVDPSQHPRPVLRDHDPKRPVGHTTGFNVEGTELLVDVVMSGSGADTQEVIDSSENDFPWQVSMGAKVLKNQFVPEGQSATANGRTWNGPINIARKTFMREVSILTLGADDNTSARIAAKAAGRSPMPVKFKSWLKASNFNAEDMDAEAMKCARAMFKAMNPDADENDDSDDDDDDTDDIKDGGKANSSAKRGKKGKAINAAAKRNVTVVDDAGETPEQIRAALVNDLRSTAKTERQRQSLITAQLTAYKPRVEAAKYAEIEASAFDDDSTPETVELALLRAARPEVKASSFNINTGKGGDADGMILAAVAGRSMGLSEKIAYSGLDERSGNIASSIRSLSMHEIIARSAARMGMPCHAGGITDDFIPDFLRADRESHKTQLRAAQADMSIRASSGSSFSTMSLTGITENILNKMMLESYAVQASVVSDIAYERDTTDLKPFKVYRLTASGDFLPVGPNGELKNFGLQDESYANQVTTKGALLVLKREDILNDDMGALTQSSQVLGRKAQLNRERTVITTLLSGLTTIAPGPSVGKPANAFNFLSTGAKNYLNGAGSALTIDSLSLADQTFTQQVDANGDPIGIIADRILVCPELKVTAKALFKGADIVVNALGSTTAKGTQPNWNAHAGVYKPLVSPFLGGKSSVTGASATQWMIMPNPSGGMAPVQVGYLRGQRTPVIRQVDTDAAMLGIAYQAIYDFGVALLDYRTIVYSAGQ